MTDDQLISGRFAVVGNPVEHSLSPRIHAAFARQGRRQIDYRAERVGVDDFEGWVSAFFNAEGHGLNVTLPFKTRAFDMADTVSDRARLTGAANFLTANEAGGIHADNTDGKGLLIDVTANAGWILEGARILVLGAGGAVKGVIPSLLDAGPAALVVANRKAERAEALAAGRMAVVATVVQMMVGQVQSHWPPVSPVAHCHLSDQWTGQNKSSPPRCRGLIRGIATPALLCHKEQTRRIQSPLLGALERKIPPLLGVILLAPRWFFLA